MEPVPGKWEVFLQKIQTLRQRFPFSSIAFPAIVIVILLVAVVATVTLSLQRQITKSGASSSDWTLQVNPKADVNLSAHTITAHIELIPPTDVANPLGVAAVGIHILYNTSIDVHPFAAASGVVIRPGTFSLALTALNPNANAFPVEGTNPSSIPPFGMGNTPPGTPTPCGFGEEKNHPCATPAPTVSGSSADCIPYACPDGSTHCALPQTIIGGKHYCFVTPEPTENSPRPSHPAPSFIPPRQVEGASIAPQEMRPNDQGNASSNMLYFSVGNEYGKVVTKQILLADVVFTVNARTPEGQNVLNSLSSLNSTTLANFEKQFGQYLSSSLTVRIGPDSKVFTLGTDPKNPFVRANYVGVPAAFTLADLLGIHPSTIPAPIPTHCGGNISPAPTCPTGYVCKLGRIPDGGGTCVPITPSIVTCTPRPPCLDTKPASCKIAVTSDMCPPSPSSTPSPTTSPNVQGLTANLFFACAEPTITGGLTMQDPNSRYNSASCQKYPNRQNADLNNDGIVNLIDWNIWYRATFQPSSY